MRKLYLAHPFPSRKRMRVWELRIEKKLGIEFLNPFYDSEQRTLLHQLNEGTITVEQYYNHPLMTPKVCIERDLGLIKEADGILACIDGNVTVGTIMEIVYAATVYKKPVFIVVTNGKEYHPWLRYHATELFTSLKEFSRWLKRQKNTLRS